MGLESQQIIGVVESGAVAVSDEVNAVVGTTATVINNADSKQHLVLMADKNGFRLRIGSVAGSMPAAEFPAASVTNDTAGVYIAEGKSLVIPAPTNCTVKGYAADSVLTYYFI